MPAILQEQSLPLRREPQERAASVPEPRLLTAFDTRRANRTGIVVTVLLHALVVLIAYQQPDPVPEPVKAGASNAIAYIVTPAPRSPLPAAAPVLPAEPVARTEATPPPPPKPRDRAPVRRPAPLKPPPQPEMVEIERLPDTITPPPVVPEVPKAAPAQDMAAMIAARQRARQRASGIGPRESADMRAQRLVRENVAMANRGAAGDADSGREADISVEPISPFAARITYTSRSRARTGRSGRVQVEVELGKDADIETASVRKMIELIRQDERGDFDFISERQGREILASARPKDQAALERLLFKEFFPEHPRAR